jgi:histidine triad (HIT) family protein
MTCVFCAIESGRAEASVVYEDTHVMAFMDIYPWRPGHVLVIPRHHSARVAGLSDERLHEIWGLGLRVAAALRASPIPCDDLHFALNDGRAANQSVPHVHLHVLPRTRGDLARLVASAAKRPLVGLLGPRPRSELDRHAAEVRAHL